MNCKKCGAPVDPGTRCRKCGSVSQAPAAAQPVVSPPVAGAAPNAAAQVVACADCGQTVSRRASQCVHCGAPMARTPMDELAGRGTQTRSRRVPVVHKSRVAYILLGIFLGGLGIHNFYAGRIGVGITQLLITLFLSWLVIPVFVILLWVLIEICAVSKDGRGVPFS